MRPDSNNGNRPEVASDEPKAVASLAGEKSRAEKRDLAGLHHEKERPGPNFLQRRGRGSALLRLDRRRDEIDRRKLFRAAVQPAPEREKPALGDKQGARPANAPRRIDDARREG